MPQADILTFRATLLLLPVIFLLGYYFFATVWVPRLLLTLKARAWLTRVEAAAPLVVLTSGDNWPELFLMFVQFIGLVWVVSTVGVTTPVARLPAVPTVVTRAVTFATVGGPAVENFFLLWSAHRQTLFFAPAGALLSTTVNNVFNSFTFYTPGKQFPFLLGRLRQRLPTVVSELTTQVDG